MSIFKTIGQSEQEFEIEKFAGGGEKEKEPTFFLEFLLVFS